VIVWRFSQQESLDVRGGLLASARWHTRGAEILYCAPNPATAVLEVLVHADVREPAALGGHKFLKIEIPDDVSRQSLDEGQLPQDWSRQVRVTRACGDRWLVAGQTAILIVPSVLVPETHNVLVNPRHVDAAHIERLATFPYVLDPKFVERH
jgi:RES domain-containing protein